MKKLPSGAIPEDDERVPYPIRISSKDIKALKSVGIDIPETVRSFIRDLAKQIRDQK